MSTQQTKKQIIVIGIYRSGTSLISGTLAKLGIDVGNHKNHSNQHNPKGYWECEDSIALNLKLRKMCGHDLVFAMDKNTYKQIEDNPDANNAIKKYIEGRDKDEVWALKDPKMLPFYFMYEKHLTNPYLIFIKRERESVIESWKKIERAQEKQIDATYERHLEMYNDILEHAKKKKIPMIEISYSYHIDNTKESAGKIADFVGVENNDEAVSFCEHYSLSGKK